MGKLNALTLTTPGKYGINSSDDILADQAKRFVSLASNAVIDSSGKLVTRQDFINQTSGFTNTLDTLYVHRNNDGTETVMTSGSGVIYSGIGSLTSRFDHTAGSQIVDVGGAKVGATATGLANSAEVYGFTVAIDGAAAIQVSVTGSAAQTWTTLLAEINTDLVGATAVLVGGNLKIISDATGASSTVAISTGKGTASNAMLTTLTGFVAVRAPIAGTATNDNWQFASLNSRIFAAQANQHLTVLNESTFAVESIVAQPWSGGPNVVIAADGRIWTADDQGALSSGYQVVTVGGNKTPVSLTDLISTTTYTASVIIDGAASQAISIAGSAATTFALLLDQLRIDTTNCTWDLIDGNIRCTSNAAGTNSTVAITAGTLFAAPLAGFVAVATAVAGSATAAANRYTIWWSDLLNGLSWDGGDAGELNLQNAWPEGQDSIIALTFFSGRLVVLGRSSILMYTLPADHDPASMTLTDVINNIGCVARDTVITTDDGVYFLSDNGVYRINRLGQVTALMTLPNMSKLVSDDILASIAAASLPAVRAGYYPNEGYYLLSFPASNKSYCFHTRRPIPDLDVPAVTTWTNVGVSFNGFDFDKDGTWYAACRNGVHKYSGYTTDGASNVYTFDLFTQWMDADGKSFQPKDWAITLEAPSGQTGTAKWLNNFLEGSTSTQSFTCSAIEFAENPGIGIVSGELSEGDGDGCTAIKFGFVATVTAKLTLHAIRLYSVGGRLVIR